MSILVAGALAFDHIMDFSDRFKNHIMPDKIHILNVSFAVDNIKRSWGGTAGNIAFGIKMLAGDPIIISAVGKDGDEYLHRLEKMGIKTDYIIKDAKLLTASCFITTDMDDNQITTFYNGPFFLESKASINNINESLGLAIISPNKKSVMISQIKKCSQLGIKTAFDPGQQITSFNRNDLKKAITASYFVLGNDYEIRLMEKHSGWTKKEILKRTRVLITTLGKFGSIVETNKGEIIKVKACQSKKVVDPTGAGDAYRAGFFIAYEQGLDLKTCAQTGSVLASYAVETQGTQEYYFTKKSFYKRCKKAFNA